MKNQSPITARNKFTAPLDSATLATQQKELIVATEDNNQAPSPYTVDQMSSLCQIFSKSPANVKKAKLQIRHEKFISQLLTNTVTSKTSHTKRIVSHHLDYRSKVPTLPSISENKPPLQMQSSLTQDDTHFENVKMCVTTRSLPQQSPMLQFAKLTFGTSRNIDLKTFQVARAIASGSSTPATEMMGETKSQHSPMFRLNSQYTKQNANLVVNTSKSYIKEQYATIQNPRPKGIHGSFLATAPTNQNLLQDSIRDRFSNKAEVTSLIIRPERKSPKGGKILSPIRFGQAPKVISLANYKAYTDYSGVISSHEKLGVLKKIEKQDKFEYLNRVKHHKPARPTLLSTDIMQEQSMSSELDFDRNAVRTTQVNENVSFGGDSNTDNSAHEEEENWVYMKKQGKLEDLHRDRRRKKEELE